MSRRVRHALSLVVLALALLTLAAGSAAAADTQAPQVVGTSVSPASVDISSSAQTVTYRAHITDDSSGVAPGQSELGIAAPGAGIKWYWGPTLESGTPTDGVYAWTVTIPAKAHPGNYPIYEVRAGDNAGHVSYQDGNPSGTAVAVTGSGDASPVQVSGVRVSPSAVDPSSGDKSVGFTLHLTDDMTGVDANNLAIGVTRPGYGNQWFYSPVLVSGTPNDGWYQWQIPIPHGAPAGTVSIYSIWASDFGWNTTYLTPPAGSNATVGPGGGIDVAAPVVLGARFTPTSVDVTNGAAATLDVSLFDNGAGVSGTPVVTLASPTGFTLTVPLSLVSGSANDGGWRGTMNLPSSTEPGTWTIVGIAVHDAAGNTATYTQGDFAAAGISIPTLHVTSAADTTPPTVVCGQADASWHADEVTVSCTASDAESGLRIPPTRRSR